jgi:alanyl-tRNA synthetase
LREKLGATEFLGYDTEQAEGVVLALVKDGKEVPSVAEGETVGVIVNQTPFYGESGGQIGDTGVISGEDFSITITDTQKKADGLFIHLGKVTKGAVKVGVPVELKVAHARRSRLRSNHSATHLLHEALREVLGTHVAQKGSLVAPERLRFDFSHPSRFRRKKSSRWSAWRTRLSCRTALSPRA